MESADSGVTDTDSARSMESADNGVTDTDRRVVWSRPTMERRILAGVLYGAQEIMQCVERSDAIDAHTI